MDGRRLLTVGVVALAVSLAMGGLAAPAAAGHHGGEGADDHGSDDAGDNRCDEPGRDSGESPGCSERGRADDDPTFAFDIGLDRGPVAGYFRVTCDGSPQDHACVKDGGLTTGPAGVDYSGNNSADPLGMEGGGGDTVTVAAGNQSGSASFDCEFTTATVTNASACTVGGSP